ncbi:LuxR family two component transcriptional regulator [Winogradskyella eximia]|uniref:LuxR family two component transcriptional regulator n=1 Tax=Winogradskyella eximia TaxID=262006 RepID=A0A3D9GYV3_9FLAO|nr:response regulator transcription factor [Winogradskyella eximia]RED42124.1 LuxR family two component transcriptional regulator [Winogradskyella eximia]
MIDSITLFVADDHPLLLKGLVDQLKEYNYNVIGTAENGAIALNKIMELQPQIAILDEEMPMLTGFEVIKKCKEQLVDTKFIILTSHKEKAFIYKAQKLNISGYIIKDEPFLELHNCIQSISKGVPYFSAVFNTVLENEVAPQLQKMKLLTPSERTIVRFIAQDKSSKDIAALLSLSARTIEKHRSNIITKLGLAKEKDILTSWAKENIEFVN